MLLRNLLRLSAAGKPIYGTPDIGIDASQIIAETATGDHGPGLLYAPALAHPTKQLRVKITSWSGTPGTLFVFENGSLLIDELQADGAYTIGYDWEAWTADGTLTVVSDTSPVQIGPQNATAPATTVSGTSTINAGQVIGEQNATAPATTVTGASTINAGTATGGGSVDATAPATTVNGASSINAGQGAGQQNATAPATTVTGASTINAGTATGGNGNVDATAPVTTVTGASSINAGTATGQQNATAPATTVTGTSTIEASQATGDIDATAPATTISGASTIVAGDPHQQAHDKIVITTRIAPRAIIRAGVNPAMKTLIGNTVGIAIDIRNAAEELVDAPDIAIAILAPGSAQETTVTPARISTGRYTYDLHLTVAGTWYWQVRAVSPLPGVAEGAITVSPSRFTH